MIPGRHFLYNLVARRTLLFQLVRRDFQQRYVGSVAGWLWGVVQPLVLLASWTFVFQVCLHTPMPKGAVTDKYTLFLFCGFLPWLLFQETVTRSCASLLEQANLITKTVFPSEVVPVSIFLSSLIHHLIGLAVVITAVLIMVRHISVMVLFLPLYMVLLGLFAVGIGWIVSSLQVYLRDTAQVLSVVLTLWFWITPILIPREQVPSNFQPLVAWNPMSYVVGAYRDRLLSSRWPSWRELAVFCAYSMAAFVLGGLFFRHVKRGFADVL